MNFLESDKIQFLVNLDVFPKLRDDVKIKTEFGVTVVLGIIVSFLTLSELYDFVKSDLISEVLVDTSIGQKLQVNIDMDLPGLSCDDFGLDMVDSSGDQQLEIIENMKKTPLSKGGCKIKGFLEANKVQGEFHIAFGRKAEATEQGDSTSHIHRFTYAELSKFNSSHRINKISFGADFPGVLHPLDGMQKIVTKGAGRYQYYIQIVPTLYKFQNGKYIYTNQYSVTELDVNVDVTAPTFKQPGIFFKYDLSPYSVVYEEKYRSFSHFLTRCAAIIGGMYVVTGMTTSIVWFVQREILKKGVQYPLE